MQMQAQRPEMSAFQINDSYVESELADSVAQSEQEHANRAYNDNEEDSGVPNTQIVDQVEVDDSFQFEAPDKSMGDPESEATGLYQHEQQLEQPEQPQFLDDSFACQFDPAELAFQREQLLQIEDQRKENEYKERLEREAGLTLLKTSNDGNCLYRAVSRQLYGDDRHHKIVRQKCMEYIHLQGKYFMGFIDKGRYGSIREYVTVNKRDKVWGDNIEIQAMAELYALPIEIYEYGTAPARVFNQGQQSEQSHNQVVLRLSFHNRNHYNAVVPLSQSPQSLAIYRQAPGLVENQRIALVMASMNPVDIPDDFELNEKTTERTRASIIFEEELARAIEASRGGFERSMSVVEPEQSQPSQAAVSTVSTSEEEKKEEEKKGEEVSTSRKIKNKFKKFFKQDLGNWISAGVTGIAGPPVALMGKVSDEVSKVLDDSSDEELEAQVRQIKAQKKAKARQNQLIAQQAAMQARVEEAEQVQLAMAISASEQQFEMERDRAEGQGQLFQ